MKVSEQVNDYTGSEAIVGQDAVAVESRQLEYNDIGFTAGVDGAENCVDLVQSMTNLAFDQERAVNEAAAKQRVSLKELRLDQTVYGRANVDKGTVEKYYEAFLNGDVFPPIIVEKGTDRVLDGWHRVHAKQKLAEYYYQLVGCGSNDPLAHVPESDVTTIDCNYHEVPDGLSPRVYAFRFNLKHGKPATDADYRLVVREWFEINKGATYESMARDLNIHWTTVKRYVSDCVLEFNDQLKKIAVQLCSEGFSHQEIVKKLKAQYPKARISQPSISDWVKDAKQKCGDNRRRKTSEVITINAKDGQNSNSQTNTSSAQDLPVNSGRPVEASPSCAVTADEVTVDGSAGEEQAFSLIWNDDRSSCSFRGLGTVPEPLRGELESRLQEIYCEFQSRFLEVSSEDCKSTACQSVENVRYNSPEKTRLSQKNSPITEESAKYICSAFINPRSGRFKASFH